MVGSKRPHHGKPLIIDQEESCHGAVFLLSALLYLVLYVAVTARRRETAMQYELRMPRVQSRVRPLPSKLRSAHNDAVPKNAGSFFQTPDFLLATVKSTASESHDQTQSLFDAMTMDRQLLGSYRKRLKARQACDCCHGRKIRCDASMPCSNCEVTRVPCTYLSVPKKSGPKGPRMIRGSRAVTRAMINGEEGNARSATTLGSNTVGKYGRSVRTDLGLSQGREGFQSSPLITLGVIKSCVKAFFTLKYPIMPILERDEVYATLSELHDSPEKYGLITSLCAVVTLQPEVLEPPSDCDAPSSKVFIQETLRAKQYCNLVDVPSLTSVQTSFFLFAALFRVGKDRSAWFYLREAITLLQVQRLHEEGTYSGLRDKKYASACRRTFWLLFITERA